MKPFWAILNIGCVVWTFACIWSGVSPVLPLVGAVIFGGLFASAYQRDKDRRRQTEILDRLARIEEQHSGPAVTTQAAPASEQLTSTLDSDRATDSDPPPAELNVGHVLVGLVILVFTAIILKAVW